MVFPFESHLIVNLSIEITELLHHDFELVDRVDNLHAVKQDRCLADLFAQKLLELVVLGVPVFVVSRLSPRIKHRLNAEQVNEFLVGDRPYIGFQVVEIGIFGINHFHLILHQH